MGGYRRVEGATKTQVSLSRAESDLLRERYEARSARQRRLSTRDQSGLSTKNHFCSAQFGTVRCHFDFQAEHYSLITKKTFFSLIFFYLVE